MSNEALKIIEQLYIQNYDNMFSYAMAILKDPSFAEDVVQEAFCEAINKMERFMTHPNQIGWLMETLKRKIHEAQRMHTGNYRLVSLETQDDLYDQSVDDMETRVEIKNNIKEIKEILSPDEFLLLKRLSLNDERVEAVAKELGISPAACYKRYNRICQKLRQKLSHFYTD